MKVKNIGRYNNYHKHDHFGNPWTMDVVVKPEEYCKRAIELGHDTVFTTNHGVTGNIFDWLDLINRKDENGKKIYDLKLRYGTEAYFVKDRHAKDRSNKHLIIIAKNNDGVMQLNDIMTEAHTTGFYYKPRVDIELLFSLNSDNFILTTACVAGIWDDPELILALHRKFKNNFFLEVQSHQFQKQIDANRELLRLSSEAHIPIIHANDSHYIYPQDSKYRDILLKAKEIYYEDEGNSILDYPDEDEIYRRYEKQNVLSKEEVREALNNTLVFDECKTITLINDDIKLPSVAENPSEELRNIIRKQWRVERNNIPKDQWQKYTDAISYELDIVEKTNMSNYFLIDYKVAKDGQEKYDGRLTNTGRGCFTGDALVHTLECVKPLKDIEIGDKVLTIDGTFQKVVNTTKYDIDEDLIEIRHLYGAVSNKFPTCTQDHKIFIRRNNVNKWIKAQNILKSDYVCVPKVKFADLGKQIIDLNLYNSFGFKFDNDYIYEEYSGSNKRYNKKIKRYIEVDGNFNTFIGLMYGDGFTNSTKNSEIGLALNTNNHKYTINYSYFCSVANQLGLPIYENKSLNKNLSQIYLRSKVFTNFVKKELFDSKKGRDKVFNSKWLYQKEENLTALLLGLNLSDGSFSEPYRISFDNSSLSIINAYKILCLATGKGTPSMTIRGKHKDKRGYISKESYKLRLNSNSQHAKKISERTFEDDFFYYLPIKEIRILKHQKKCVYDLSIENNHNYVINNMLVHNSAPSFYITKLLGLTDIDRVSAPITLFPTRFMSVERILGTKSLPDIDMNTTDREPFIKATEDLLGKENCAWMLAWKPLQDASAFRTYCKGIGKDISEYDDIAKDLKSYENDNKWRKLIADSKRFVGVIESISESPCSMLLYNKPVRKELGLVRTSKDKFCCLLDGYNCDKYKYLKNDYLVVTVWAIIRDVCKLANIPIPTIKEINKLFDKKTFDIYKKGLTSTINQADSDYATGLVSRYKPQNVSEMSAFVAIIRPGCASLLQDFIDRKPYTTGVSELDNLLIEGNHRMIYQELIMKYLIWLGIPETGSYDIIKKIAKKKFKEAELAELKTKLLAGWKERVGREEGFIETWTVVEQAANYSFNASHSLSYAYDSLYGAYLKSHYPLEYYTVALNYYEDDSVRTLRLIDELSYFGIKLKPIQFRYSKGTYTQSKEDNSIYKGIQSIKYMNAQIADEIYELGKNKYDTFIDLLYDISSKTSTDARQLKILIDLDFFSEFGDANMLMAQYKFFDTFSTRKQFKKNELEDLGISLGIIRQYAGKETEKMFTDVNFRAFVKVAASKIIVPERKLSDRIKAQTEHLGYITIADPKYSRMAAVLSVDTKYSPRLKLYSLKNGTTLDCKIDKRTFNRDKLMVGDIVKIIGTKEKPKSKKNENGEWEAIPGTKELWISAYNKIENL